MPGSVKKMKLKGKTKKEKRNDSDEFKDIRMRKKRKWLTLKEKKKLYKTIAGYKAARRKKNAERLNEELKQ